MDNLPSDPSNPNNSNSNPLSPNTQNLPDSSGLKDPAQSEVAKHQHRGPDGKFISSEHPVEHLQTSPTNPDPVSTPESNFKRFIKFIVKIKWTKVTFYIVGLIGVVNVIISLPPVRNTINQLFPHSSPVLAREISIQGILRSFDTGSYILVLPNQEAYTLHFKPSASLTNLKKLNEVVVKGNLTWTPYVIENAEVYPVNISTP